MATFAYMTSAELMQIEQAYLPVLIAGNPWFAMFPFKNVEAAVLQWEQKDNYIGLQQVRGLNGAPGRVAKVGIKQYLMKPGVYGEFLTIDEEEITNRRRIASFNEPINIDDLIRDAQDQLLTRRLMRQKKLITDLVVQGFFSVLSPSNAVLHTDGYTQRIFAATVAWGTAATATPLADFRAVKLLKRGYSVSFGATATAWMNQTTFNQLMGNTNSADVGGKRLDNGQTINDLAGINRILSANDLPSIAIWDEGYIDDSSVFQLDIPNSVVVVEGKRTSGTPIGNFIMTRNANNPSAAPGPYMKVFDRSETQVPADFEVHDGHNGGPAIYFPSAIVIMKV